MHGSIYQFFYPTVCLFIYIITYLSISHFSPAPLSLYVHVCKRSSMCACLRVYIYACYKPFCLFAGLLVCLYHFVIYLTVFLPVWLSVYLPFFLSSCLITHNKIKTQKKIHGEVSQRNSELYLSIS